MKKIIMLWLFAIISIVGIAQNTTEHLSYMGIPITGTITQFQTKLQAKRCSLDKQTSNSLGVGCRAFKGNFIGNKVTIFVYYDEKTKVVYRVKSVISKISESIADQKYEYIKNMLLQKYGMTYSNYVITAKRKACGIKNEMRFSDGKTKCAIKKHPSNETWMLFC